MSFLCNVFVWCNVFKIVIKLFGVVFILLIVCISWFRVMFGLNLNMWLFVKLILIIDWVVMVVCFLLNVLGWEICWFLEMVIVSLLWVIVVGNKWMLLLIIMVFVWLFIIICVGVLVGVNLKFFKVVKKFMCWLIFCGVDMWIDVVLMGLVII